MTTTQFPKYYKWGNSYLCWYSEINCMEISVVNNRIDEIVRYEDAAPIQYTNCLKYGTQVDGSYFDEALGKAIFLLSTEREHLFRDKSTLA